MTTTLTIELPDELAENLQAQANKLQVSVSTLVEKSLTDTLSNHNSPIQNESTQIGSSSTDSSSHFIPPATNNEVETLLLSLREAYLQGKNSLEVPATDFALFLTPILQDDRTITKIQPIQKDNTPWLLLESESHFKSQSTISPVDLDDPIWSEDIRPLIRDLKDPSEEVRLQAITALGALFCAKP